MGIDKEGFKREKGKPSKAEDWGIIGSEESEMKKPKYKIGQVVEVENAGTGVVEDVYECCKKWRYKVIRENTTTCAFEDIIKPVNVFKDGADLEEQYAEQVKEENGQANDDPVNHPSHYTQGGIECIEALKAATVGMDGIEAVCTANAIKYLWRQKRKKQGTGPEKSMLVY